MKKKYCEILNNKVNWIFSDNPDLYSILNIKDITERKTILGNEIVEGDYYDSLHDLYIDNILEYKNFQEKILIENNNALSNIENQLLEQQENIQILNEKIDSLAKFILFLKG